MQKLDGQPIKDVPKTYSKVKVAQLVERQAEKLRVPSSNWSGIGVEATPSSGY